MSKILIQTSAGELIDKITILEIKREKISDSKSLEIVDKEYTLLKQTAKENLKINSEIENLWNNLKEVNLKLWEVEDEIRLAE